MGIALGPFVAKGAPWELPVFQLDIPNADVSA
jgi:hypothetical protein